MRPLGALQALACAVFVRALTVSPAGVRPAQPTLAVVQSAYSLHDAAAAGDANAVELLLAAGLSTDTLNDRSSTPLHLACAFGHDEVAAVLLGCGASSNTPNQEGNTPLHAAVGSGELPCVQLLLSHGADADATSHAGTQPLRSAVHRGDAAMVSAFVASGAELDEATAQAAFWVAVQRLEAAADGAPLPAEVPALLQHVFAADMQQLLRREKQVQNVTCLQPAVEGTGNNVIDDALASTPLHEGRACDGGCCADACSRVVFPTFATDEEVEAFRTELEHAMVEPFHQFSLSKCAFRDARTTLLFVRFVERMRRAIAHEYGLELSSVLPGQAFVARFDGEQDQQGGLHSDESTHREFHYSCVFYMASQHEDFDGGTLLFSDAAPEAGQAQSAEQPGGGAGTVPGAERVLSPLSPSRGMAIIFSSGWENMHIVEPLASGTRIAVPAFFTTQRPEGIDPTPDVNTLWGRFLAPESAEDVRQFMFSWHELCATGR